MKKEETMKIATLTAAALTAVCALADEKPAYLDTSLTKLELGLFNDTGKYQPEQEDGIRWNNDTGVKMTIRNVEILTDRPE